MGARPCLSNFGGTRAGSLFGRKAGTEQEKRCAGETYANSQGQRLKRYRT